MVGEAACGEDTYILAPSLTPGSLLTALML